MALRATRVASEIVGRGDTTRLNATRAAAEVLGRGATDCIHATQVRCEVLGEYSDPTIRTTAFHCELLGRGDNNRLQATQAGCEILGEYVEPVLRTTALSSEVLGGGDNDRTQVTCVRCEILGEQIPPVLHVTMVSLEVAGRGDNDRLQATQVGCEILGEGAVAALRVIAVNLEVLGEAVFSQYGLNMDYYGSVYEAQLYFESRLHENAWSNANPEDRPKALWAATQIIDALNFKGYKHPVYLLLQQNSRATAEQIRVAEASQTLEFPRDAETDVPEAIRRACYEIAHSLLDGKDPELELEALGITSQTYASVKTVYSREQVPIEHLVNGVPNARAWQLLRPFLRDSDELKLSRIS